MNLEFDWQVGNEQDQQETLAHIARRRRRLVPRWVWLLVAAIVVLLGTGAYALVRQRYNEARARVAFQIQAVIDLEAAAYARGDVELFLEQQDRAAPEWYASQATRVGAGCFDDVSGAASDALPREWDGYPCEPVLPATVLGVELRRSVAWVEVTEGQPPVRRARFYRQTDLGWKHTAPEVEFWGTAVEVRYGSDLVFRYHRRDRPHVQPAVDRIVEAFDRTCATFGCTPEAPIEISFVADMPRLMVPERQGNEIRMPSPWVAGIPISDAEASYLADYAYVVAYEVGSAQLRASADRPLTAFEAALVGEYAAWQSAAGPGRAPVVDLLVERRGADALPAILASSSEVGSLNLLMVQWLGLSVSARPSAYFETLVNLEQRALAAGRKETFLLLQDETVPGWLAAQEAFFDLAQTRDLAIEPARVQGVDLSGELARVILDRPTALAEAHALAPTGQIVYFRRQDGDWKHTSPRYTRAEPGQLNLSMVLADASLAGAVRPRFGAALHTTAPLAAAVSPGQTTLMRQ